MRKEIEIFDKIIKEWIEEANRKENARLHIIFLNIEAEFYKRLYNTKND